MSFQPSNPALRPVSRNSSSPELPVVSLLGLDLVNAERETALDWLMARLDAREPTRVAFYNAHCGNVAAADPAYQSALQSADAVLPDGSGVALATRLNGQRLTANLNGTDFTPALCTRLAASGHSVFLLGAQPGVAADAARALRRQAPGLIIAGTAHGFFTAEDEDKLIARINASGADVVLVAMGVPKQDLFLARISARLQAPLTLGVGALFDFLANRVSRAPSWLRAAGLEWTWRLAQEPRRLARRYLLGNPEFIGRALRFAAAPALARADLATKRGMDIAAAAGGLVFAAPLLLTAMAAIRLTSPGSPLLRQTRIGQDGKPFTLWKLRSMYQDADARRAALLAANQHGADAVTFKLKADPRITPVGAWLRRSSLDELPQLWNILVGDMSLVGPRPPLPQEVARYTPAQRQRLAAKPGLTCLWQVSGRANLPFDRQVELDVEYLSTRSVLKDILILLRTVPAVLTARGAY